MTISIPGVEGDRDRLRLLREGVREDMVVTLCRSGVPDMVKLPVACVADMLLLESVVEPTIPLPLLALPLRKSG